MQYTWHTEEAADFIKTATALICAELHQNLHTVRTNCLEIMELMKSWSECQLEIFAARDPLRSYTIEELVEQQQ